MKGEFVLIFREGTRQLSLQEQTSRTEEVRNWALRQMKESNLDPRILGEQSQLLGDYAVNPSTAGSVIALNFLEAESFERAVEITKTHPGLRYGVCIEVRPWKDPRSGTGSQRQQ